MFVWTQLVLLENAKVSWGNAKKLKNIFSSHHDFFSTTMSLYLLRITIKSIFLNFHCTVSCYWNDLTTPAEHPFFHEHLTSVNILNIFKWYSSIIYLLSNYLSPSCLTCTILSNLRSEHFSYYCFLQEEILMYSSFIQVQVDFISLLNPWISLHPAAFTVK